eukprot:704836-Hanusia_phi.AAC.2
MSILVFLVVTLIVGVVSLTQTFSTVKRKGDSAPSNGVLQFANQPLKLCPGDVPPCRSTSPRRVNTSPRARPCGTLTLAQLNLCIDSSQCA